MAFCANCGAEVTSGFCGKCGAAVGGSAPPAGEAPVQSSAGGLDDNVASLLCYLGGVITGVIFLVLAPYNQKKIIRFHAFQSIFTVLAMFVFGIAWMILSMIVAMISGILGGLMSLMITLVWLGFFGLWIYLMVSAYQGKKIVLPLVGPLAEKQA